MLPWKVLCIAVLCVIQAYCCPDGYINDPSLNICYRIYKSSVRRSVASRNCAADGARLAVITNAYINSAIFNAAKNQNTQVWIGITCDPENHCVWDDASNYARGYKNYYPGNPNTVYGNCTYMTTNSNGRWLNGECEEMEIGYACIASTSASSLCGDYSYNYNTGMCYKAFPQDEFIPDPEGFCINDGGHLVSITSSSENQFVTNLLSSSSLSARIGLFTSLNSIGYQWTDGTYFGQNSYSNFGNLDAGLGLCMAMGTGQDTLPRGTWGNTECGSGITDTFVCKRNPGNAAITTAGPVFTTPSFICGQNYRDNNWFYTPGFGDGSDLPAGFSCEYFFTSNYYYAQVTFNEFYLNTYSSISLYNSYFSPYPFITLYNRDGLYNGPFISDTNTIYMVFNDTIGGRNPLGTMLYNGYFSGSYDGPIISSTGGTTGSAATMSTGYWWPEKDSKDSKDIRKERVEEEKKVAAKKVGETQQQRNIA